MRRYSIRTSLVLTPEGKEDVCKYLGIELGEGQPVFDSTHDQDIKCSRIGCTHPYRRHFFTENGFGDETFYITSCKYCSCPEFVESTDSITALSVTEIEDSFRHEFDQFLRSHDEV